MKRNFNITGVIFLKKVCQNIVISVLAYLYDKSVRRSAQSYILFSAFPARKAMKRPKQAAAESATLRPVSSDSQPITGGPTRKPKKLMLDTMVMAILAFIVPSFPARL